MLALTQFTGFNARRRTSGIVRGRGIAGITLGLAGAGDRHRVGAGSTAMTLGLAATGTVRTVVHGAGTAGITLGLAGAGTMHRVGAGTAGITLGLAGAGRLNPWVDCVAYWPLEEASGNRVDATGRGNDLVPFTSYVYQTPGKVGYGVNLAPPGSLRLNSTSDVQPNAPFSACGWMIPLSPGAPPYSVIVKGVTMDGSDSADEWGVWGDPFTETLTFWTRGSGGVSSVNVSVADLDTTWVFWAAVCTGSELILSINGGTPYSVSCDTPVAGDETLYFASPTGGYESFADETGIFAKALSGGEIAELYNGGAGVTYNP